MGLRQPRGAAPVVTESSTRARTEPLSLVVQADIEERHLATIRAVSDRVQLVDRHALERDAGVLERAEILFTQKLDPRRIARAPNLRWVQTYGAGVEWLLTPEVIARTDLRVTNARGIHAQPIAEHVFGLLLTFIRRLDGALLLQQRAEWAPATLIGSLRTLEGTTLGILGLGAIGARIAAIGKAFGMRVIGTRLNPVPTAGVDRVLGPDALDALLAEADYVVNALPSTAETRGLLGCAALARLRRDAVVINIGRGDTIDTDALVEALRAGALGGALLDVTAPEPLPGDHPLWRLPNVLITPHYSGAHPGYRDAVTAVFVDNLRRYVEGEPLVNLVDKVAGY